MPALSEFLKRLFRDGEAVVDARPAEPDEAEALAVLERAFATRSLEVAGPAIAFHAAIALAAAQLLQQACWFLISRQERSGELAKQLRMPGRARTPGEHLSADLTLRYLSDVYRRAQGLDPTDALTKALEQVLREWPLSGVVSRVTEPPLGDMEFGGHRGLQMLYAERLAGHLRPAWIPTTGPTRPITELVWHELGRDMSELIPVNPAAEVAEAAEEGAEA